MKERAIILLSGGLDSVTMAAIYHKKYSLHGLIFDYGQMHDKETVYAKKAAMKYCETFEIMDIELPMGTGSKLASATPDKIANWPKEISEWWVPGRNLLFLSYAAMSAMAHGAKIIFIGANETDIEGFPDCRGSFIMSIQSAINESMGLKMNTIRIRTPFVLSTKVHIISLAIRHGIDIFNDTWSCYEGGDTPCGTCDACITRKTAIKEAYNAGIIGDGFISK